MDKEELRPFYDAIIASWDFIKKYKDIKRSDSEEMWAQLVEDHGKIFDDRNKNLPYDRFILRLGYATLDAVEDISNYNQKNKDTFG